MTAPGDESPVDHDDHDQRAAATAPEPASAHLWRRGLTRVVEAGLWCFVAALAWTAVSIWWGKTWPARVTVLMQSVTPLLFVPVYVLGPLAWWRRRRALAAACVILALVHVVLMVPAVGSRTTPGWAATAPRVTVLSSNVFDRNPDDAKAVASLLAHDADVMVLVEMDGAFIQALDAAGVDGRYPYKVVGVFGPDTNNVEGIYSKLPILSHLDVSAGLEVFHEATLSLADLGRYARSVAEPLAVVGDFNATQWNPPFADLLDTPLEDAHLATGKGLSFSWPNSGSLPPFAVMRIDHALLNWRVAPLHLRDIDVAGSDHKGFVVELAVRR